MRLIDADSLIANMDKGMQGTAREYLKFYQMAVNDEPTSYDVDKVVERLEVNSMFTQEGDEAFVMLDDAIEIVKSGGIE